MTSIEGRRITTSVGLRRHHRGHGSIQGPRPRTRTGTGTGAKLGTVCQGSKRATATAGRLGLGRVIGAGLAQLAVLGLRLVEIIGTGCRNLKRKRLQMVASITSSDKGLVLI